jgi:hypothetical protein
MDHPLLVGHFGFLAASDDGILYKCKVNRIRINLIMGQLLVDIDDIPFFIHRDGFYFFKMTHELLFDPASMPAAVA